MKSPEFEKLFILLKEHEIGTCSVKNCADCEEIKKYGREIWTASNPNNRKGKQLLDPVGRLTKKYYFEAKKRGYADYEIALACGLSRNGIGKWKKENRISKEMGTIG